MKLETVGLNEALPGEGVGLAVRLGDRGETEAVKDDNVRLWSEWERVGECVREADRVLNVTDPERLLVLLWDWDGDAVEVELKEAEGLEEPVGAEWDCVRVDTVRDGLRGDSVRLQEALNVRVTEPEGVGVGEALKVCVGEVLNVVVGLWVRVALRLPVWDMVGM